MLIAHTALSNLTSQADARGCVTTLSYDLLDRLVGKSAAGAAEQVERA